jgi:hypothetical protein
LHRISIAFLVLVAACSAAPYPTLPPAASPDAAAPASKFSGAIALYSSGDAQGSSLGIVSMDLESNCNFVPLGNGLPCDTVLQACGTKHPVSVGIVHTAGTLSPITLTPSDDGHYANVTVTGPLWRGGETLHIQADGGTLFPFALSLPAPFQLSVQSGLTASTVKISHSQDLVMNVVSPNQPAGALVHVDLLSSTIQMRCRGPATSGQFVIPAAALAALPAGPVNLWVGTEVEVATTVGEWDVDGQAGIAALDQTGSSLGFIQASFVP